MNASGLIIISKQTREQREKEICAIKFNSSLHLRAPMWHSHCSQLLCVNIISVEDFPLPAACTRREKRAWKCSKKRGVAIADDTRREIWEEFHGNSFSNCSNPFATEQRKREGETSFWCLNFFIVFLAFSLFLPCTLHPTPPSSPPWTHKFSSQSIDQVRVGILLSYQPSEREEMWMFSCFYRKNSHTNTSILIPPQHTTQLMLLSIE